MELWDLYDENRKKIGRTHVRGTPMEKGTFHLYINIFLVNFRGELLISQRHPEKTFPLQWEGSGGSVTAGETSYMGALRELEEEVGIIPKTQGILVKGEIRCKNEDFNDIWFFQEDIPIENLNLQETEVVDAKWVTREQLINMFKSGEMVGHLEYVLEYFYNQFIFARAKEDDIPYLLDLREKTMNPHLKNAGMPTDKFSNLQRIHYHFEGGKIIYYKGKKAGFLKYIYETDHIHLIQIQVDPKFQNQGFGKTVLEFVTERAREKKLNIHLEVLKNNPAKRLYESCGFKITEETKFAFKMVKNI